MDSLTQIVLGAACGEAVLGKKIGNKALLFGAIGGTIPDLDVILGKLLYGNSIDELAFHRGIMHSIVFAIIGAFVFGWLCFKLYDNGKRKHTTHLKDWICLYFLSIFTHPILDCFTPYGTQLFAPFTDYRVAFNTISVADPLYTLPFLFCLIMVMRYKRSTVKRAHWLKYGLILSTSYLCLTIINKVYVDSVFKKAFEDAEVTYSRFSAQPTILNNILWYGIAETETDYKVTFYSLFDNVSPSENIISLSKNRDGVNLNHPDIKTLSWFSDGYFNIVSLQQEGTTILRYNDLRYPLLNPNDKNSSLFSFGLKEKALRWHISPLNDRSISKNDFKSFLERIKGIE